jgi:predicted ATPase
MITDLLVSNYRSLGDDVFVKFADLTALVGPNGSGKSNVVDALRFVADAMHIGLAGAITNRNGITAVRRWSAGHPFNVSLRINLTTPGGGGASYAFELAGDRAEEYRIRFEEGSHEIGGQRHRYLLRDGQWLEGPSDLRPALTEQSLALPLVGGDRRFAPLLRSLQSVAIYAIFPDTLRAPQKYDARKPMDLHGSNWASILRDQDEATWKPELITALNRLTGDIDDVVIEQAAGLLVTRFRHRLGETRAPATTRRPKTKLFDAAQESDGTLRFAGIVTALLQEPPLPVVGVEEPELTVHPGAIPLLYDYLRQACKRSQVIVTTHSPELLDLLRPENVRVVVKQDGVTTVRRMADSQRQIVRDGLMTLGDVMRTEGLQQELSFPEHAADG